MAINLDLLLKVMVQNKASDIHIRGDSQVFLRINGTITPVNSSNMTAKEVEDLVFPLMNDRLKSIFAEKHEADFSFENAELGRFRFNVFTHKGRIGVAVRHIPLKIPTFEELRLPVDSIKKLLTNERGLILVTGITGSGKTSTLAAMVEFLNQTWDAHIITVEDPVEFAFTEKRCIISQREIGSDTNNFVEALRGAMRQDPDVILVGEMRDLETTQAAITAAETGHLVLATLHTMNAVQTISRIIDLFPPHQQVQVRMQLAETLKGIVSQRLLQCSRGGRLPAVEIMTATPHIKKMIADNTIDAVNQAITKGGFYGMQSFNQSLVKMHKDGMAKLEDIIQAASNPDDVLLAIKGIEQEIEPGRGK
ncbi:MAG: type IV pili twitching motility protein PilT [Elusimicrobia bacterium CG08_land_8_20_14_0_20_59_10]|nr:MAG: type IV pili twitching motility protein PilT [Elusimicrobia bacterium CG08_land_8_20_14_0_20_59_10]